MARFKDLERDDGGCESSDTETAPVTSEPGRRKDRFLNGECRKKPV
ncbi:MAG: hypothetical protein IJM50_04000 [Lachnospiraceae bacterium]|nr:hypothetical protein [Lachnospiraceae bacterium]